MDAEAWNAKVREVNVAVQRAARMAALHADLVRLAMKAEELEMPLVADQLQRSVTQTFRLAALAQQYVVGLRAALEAARAAGEEPS